MKYDFTLEGEALLAFLASLDDQADQESGEGLSRPLRLFLQKFRPDLVLSVSQQELADAMGVSRWSINRDARVLYEADPDAVEDRLVAVLDSLSAKTPEPA